MANKLMNVQNLLSFILVGLIIATLVILLRPFLAEGIPYTHDGEMHVARIANYAAALRDGQFPPRIAPYLWEGVGYPVFVFNYPLSNILGAILIALGLSAQSSYKLLIFGYLLVGLFDVERWLAGFGLWRPARLFGVLSWLLMPYLFTLIYFRGSIGELAAISIIPWIFYSLTLIKQNSKWGFVLLFLTSNALFLAHNIMAVFSWLIIFPYAIFIFKSNWKSYFHTLLAIILAGLASLWFWLPALAEMSLTVLSNAGNNKEAFLHSPTLYQLLFSPVRFGFSFPGNVDSMSFQLGFGLIMLLLSFAILLICKCCKLKINQVFVNQLIFFSGLITLLIFLQLPFLSFIWHWPILNFIQFPWRLTLLSFPLIAILSALLLNFWLQSKLFPIKFKFALISTLIIFLSLILLNFTSLKPVDKVNLSPETYLLYPHSTSTQNENLPLTAPSTRENRPDKVAIIEGEGSLQIISWVSTKRTYQVKADNNLIIAENVFSYPGWEIKAKNLVDNSVVQPETDPNLYHGWLAYKLPAGEYEVSTQFTENTLARIVGNITAIFAYSFILIMLIYSSFTKTPVSS